MTAQEIKKTRRTKEEVQLASMSTDELFVGCEEAFQRLTRIKAELKLRFQNLPTSLVSELLPFPQATSGIVHTVPMNTNSSRLYNDQQPMLMSSNNIAPKPIDPLAPNQDSFVAPLSPGQIDLDNQFNHLQTTINSKMAHLQRINQLQPESRIEEEVAPF